MAKSVEFKQVSVDVKTGFFGHPLLQVGKTAAGEIHNLTTAGANQVMVVLHRPSHHVAPTSLSGMYPAYELEFTEQVKSAVNCNPPNITILQPGSLIYRPRGEMVMASSDGVQHGMALRS